MNIRPLESLTKEELIELIRHERESHTVDTPEMTPIAHRLIFKLNADKEWPHLWVDGLPNKELLDSITKDNSARVQYAYPAPVRSSHCEDILHMVPDGFKLVPDYKRGAHVKFEGVEYVIFGLGDTPGTFDIRPPRGISGDIWRNVPPHMLEILPQGTQPDHIEKDLEMVDPVVKDSLTVEPTDTEMLNWLIEKEALICHSVTANLYEIWFDIDNVETGKTAREAITKAMRGEK
mgnify:CR=1 FL=1